MDRLSREIKLWLFFTQTDTFAFLAVLTLGEKPVYKTTVLATTLGLRRHFFIKQLLFQSYYIT